VVPLEWIGSIETKSLVHMIVRVPPRVTAASCWLGRASNMFGVASMLAAASPPAPAMRCRRDAR
jgi:hypothetical protein